MHSPRSHRLHGGISTFPEGLLPRGSLPCPLFPFGVGDLPRLFLGDCDLFEDLFDEAGEGDLPVFFSFLYFFGLALDLPLGLLKRFSGVW